MWLRFIGKSRALLVFCVALQGTRITDVTGTKVTSPRETTYCNAPAQHNELWAAPPSLPPPSPTYGNGRSLYATGYEKRACSHTLCRASPRVLPTTQHVPNGPQRTDFCAKALDKVPNVRNLFKKQRRMPEKQCSLGVFA